MVKLMKIKLSDLASVYLTDHIKLPGIPCPRCDHRLTLAEAVQGCDGCDAELQLEITEVETR